MPVCLINAGPYAGSYLLVDSAFSAQAEADGWGTPLKDQESYPFPFVPGSILEPSAQSYQGWKAAGFPSGQSGDAVLTPTLSEVVPSSAAVGYGGTITCNGKDFLAGSVVYANATPLVTTYVSDTTLTAVIGSPHTAAAGSVAITVGSGSDMSAPVTFTVTAAEE